MSTHERSRPRGPAYARSGEGLEFERVTFFTDAIFAIAMTLLIVDVGIPVIGGSSSSTELAEALEDALPELGAFFLGFAVLGFYWRAHHLAFSRLRSVDGTLIGLNLLYLTFVAFLPFPTGVFGEHPDNPVAAAVFALSVAVISFLEWVVFMHSVRDHHFKTDLPPAVVRWASFLSLIPVGLFLVSIPIAFVSVWGALATWFLTVPIEILAQRHLPAGGEALIT